MAKYPGIKKENDQVYVRFKYLSKTYSIKNFTKLFGCKTEKQAFDKLQEVKVLISKNEDPFISTNKTLDYYIQKRFETKKKIWANFTYIGYSYYYDKYVRHEIGKMKVSKITYSHLRDFLDKHENKSKGHKNRFKQMLNPLFKDLKLRGEILTNPFDGIQFHGDEVSDSIYEKLVEDDIVSVAQTLYQNVKNYPVKIPNTKKEYESFLYLLLLSGHRFGELVKLTKEDVNLKLKKIISPAEITKQKRASEFPLPDECEEFIKSVNSGRIFKNIQRGSVYHMFQRLVKISKIETKKDKIFTTHDVRSLVMNIMIENKIDTTIADYCLDHSQQGIKKHYLSFSYKTKLEPYKLYWSLIRGEDLTEKEVFRKEFFKNFEKEFEKAWQQKKISKIFS